jgi:copper chaperone
MIRLSIPDMSCGHCVEAVTQAVKKADPDATLNIDLGGRTAAIETRTPSETLAAAIEQAGYPNTPLPEEDS